MPRRARRFGPERGGRWQSCPPRHGVRHMEQAELSFASDPVIEVGMAALSVAMGAKCAQLTEADVDAMRVKAEEMLPHDHPMFLAITAFATQYMEDQHAPDRLAELGRTLHDFLATWPAPSEAPAPLRFDWQDRKDTGDG